jgi:hypothetical protein
MALLMKEIGSTIRGKEKESSRELMVIRIKGNGLKTKRMEQESYIFLMEKPFRLLGLQIVCMDLEFKLKEAKNKMQYGIMIYCFLKLITSVFVIRPL